MAKILGLDLGTNSIGWALIDKEKNEILGLGSRVIPMSQDILGNFDNGVSVSQTAERTGFRGVRRLRERYLLRRERLHRVLNLLAFLPEHYAQQIDFEKRLGQFIPDSEPKLAYRKKENTCKSEFIFQKAFEEMLRDFRSSQPQLVSNGKKIPADWTIYYLRKKALTQKIEKEELAWLLLNFNQKRGYYQLRGEDEEADNNTLVEFHSLLVTDVTNTKEQNKQKQTLYKITLENGWSFIKPSNTPVEWKNKIKEFIISTDLNDDGTIKKNKFGEEKRSFRAPADDDWTLVKKKTEFDIEKSNKTVGAYIYDSLLANPRQKIKGKLVRTIERKFYKEELRLILQKQQTEHPELQDRNLYTACLNELYEYNEAHKNNIGTKDFLHLFLNDIIFYQRPLKSKKSLITDCRYEVRSYKTKDGNIKTEPIKCIAKSHPLFQEFRLWQWVKNLNIYHRELIMNGTLQTDVNITTTLLKSEEDYADLFGFLNDKKEIEQKTLLKYFKLKEATHRWNFVEDKKYPCNETRAGILTKLSKLENIDPAFLTKEVEEALWHILYSVEDKHEIRKAIKTFAAKYNLSEDFVELFSKFPPYKKEYGSYSYKAIKKMLPLMRMGKHWIVTDIDPKSFDRINKIITAEYDEKIKDRVREKAINLIEISSFKGLPLWLVCYIIYNRHSEEGEINKWETPQEIEDYLRFTFKQHSLRNPIVEQVIAETLRVVKDIWNTYGSGEPNYFSEIHVELGREMKNPADKRKQITNQNTLQENTNLRIKALLTELLNDREISNVRPYSPSQQEILKIYEDGVLNSNQDVPDDILKISKTAQPTNSELVRYKLWLEQKYRSPYTGEPIPLSKLFTSAYEIEHVIPQSRYFDNSFSNKVICEAEVNKDKDNYTAYEYIKENKGKKIELSFGRSATLLSLPAYEDFVKKHYAKNKGKQKRLLMDEIPESFIQRQLNDTRYISKVVKNLLSNVVRSDKDDDGTTSKNLIVGNGSITSILKQDWGLNDVWNSIIYPRFERLNQLTKTENFGKWTTKEGHQVFQTQIPIEFQKGFNKKRIDHRHHALDALVIACASRNHINYLNNQNAISSLKNNDHEQKSRNDLRAILCMKKYNDNSKQNYNWIFKKPWDTFTQEAKNKLMSTLISFKQNTRVINKSTNYYDKWVKDISGTLEKQKVKQTKGDSWAIRKPMHKDTISGAVTLQFSKTVRINEALENWKSITDKSLRGKIKLLIAEKNSPEKIAEFFKNQKNTWNGKDISKVEIYYSDNENVASRVKLDESFTSEKIASITDKGIQKILYRHLAEHNGDENGKLIEHPDLAFSPDGLENLNNNIKTLNDGKFHRPIYKVRTYEPMGNKFAVGYTRNKNQKFVEAAKGTNLFFGIYGGQNKKRNYETIPLNIVVERLKQGLLPVPEKNVQGDTLLFWLSPNDLVYVPNEEETENHQLKNFDTIDKEFVSKIYKVVSFSGTQCFLIRNDIANPIVNKFEFSALNKTEKSIEGIMIKECCLKLKVDRLGNIKPASQIGTRENQNVAGHAISKEGTEPTPEHS